MEKGNKTGADPVDAALDDEQTAVVDVGNEDNDEEEDWGVGNELSDCHCHRVTEAWRRLGYVQLPDLITFCDRQGDIVNNPFMLDGRKQMQQIQTIACDRGAHIRSGRAGRPIMYKGLLMSPEALRISTYSKPPCTPRNASDYHFTWNIL